MLLFYWPGLTCVLMMLSGASAVWSATEKPALTVPRAEKPDTAGAADFAKVIVIETDRGKLNVQLFPDAAPKTVARFTELVKKGFYNGLTFHRVAPKFLVQGGDPSGDGTGGSGVKLQAEFNEKKHVLGTVGMARKRDSDSADSQFYICLEPQPFLDGKYTVLGQVVEGLELLSKIQEHDVIRKITMKSGATLLPPP